MDQLRSTIGVNEPGELSRDVLFSYEEVECLGACEYAPVCRLDHALHYDLTPERVTELVAQRREGKGSPKLG